MQNLSLSLLKIQSCLPYKRVVHSLNLLQLGTARISIVEEWGPPWVLRKSGTLYGFKCWSCMQRFLRRAELHNSLYRLILGISCRDQPEKLKLELGEKMKSLPKKKKKKSLHQLKILKLLLGGTNPSPLHFGPHSLSHPTLEGMSCFFSLQPPKSPQTWNTVLISGHICSDIPWRSFTKWLSRDLYSVTVQGIRGNQEISVLYFSVIFF